MEKASPYGPDFIGHLIVVPLFHLWMGTIIMLSTPLIGKKWIGGRNCLPFGVFKNQVRKNSGLNIGIVANNNHKDCMLCLVCFLQYNLTSKCLY